MQNRSSSFASGAGTYTVPTLTLDKWGTITAAVSGTTTIYTTTSSTSNTATVGSKTFAVATGLSWTAGQPVLITNTGTPANNMYGTVTSYNSSTGAMVVNVTAVAGSTAAITAWTLNLTGAPGPTGPAPVANSSTTMTITSNVATPNAALGNIQFGNASASFTINAPINPTLYQVIEFIIFNSSASAISATLATGVGGFAFGTTAPFASFGTIAAGTYTRITAQFNSTANLWAVTNYSQGSAA